MGDAETICDFCDKYKPFIGPVTEIRGILVVILLLNFKEGTIQVLI